MSGHLKGTSAALTDVASEKSSWDAHPLGKQNHILALEWSVIGTLAIFIILGFGLRVSKLDALGFAEDEINKLEAVRSYQRGDITANAEHPMLMKALMLVSLTAAGHVSDPSQPAGQVER